MSCASFIHVNDGSSSRPLKNDFEDIEDHAALIGLQALTLNLASANKVSEEPGPRKKCLKPLSISTARKTPEKHVSISPQSATARSVGSSPRGRPSPSRSDSSGFHSLPSPQSSASDGSLGSGSGSVCWHRGSFPGDARVFTNHSNMEVKPSESLESINTRSGSGSTSRQRSTPSRSRQGTPQSRQSTPQPRHGTPQPRHGGLQSRHSTPQLRQGAQRDSQKTFEEYATIFDVQQGLKKGQLVEGVLRINPKSYKDAYISAPDGLTDIYVGGVRDRNRALHGDVVAVELRPRAEWKILEKALVTHLVSNGSPSDLENLYETDENLQKNVAALEEILPDRFPRPLRLPCTPGRAAAPSRDGVTSDGGADRANSTSAGGADAPGGRARPDSGSESDDVIVEIKWEPAGEVEKAGQASEEASDQAEQASGQAKQTGPAEETSEQVEQTSGPTERTSVQAEQPSGQAEQSSGQAEPQKTRRGTRGGRGKKRSAAAESVAARLSRAAPPPPADQLAALSLADETSDERADQADAAGGRPAAARAKPSCSSVTNPRGAGATPGAPPAAARPAAGAERRAAPDAAARAPVANCAAQCEDGDQTDEIVIKETTGCGSICENAVTGGGESSTGNCEGVSLESVGHVPDGEPVVGSDLGGTAAGTLANADSAEEPADSTPSASPKKRRSRRPDKKKKAAAAAAAAADAAAATAAGEGASTPPTAAAGSPRKRRPAENSGAGRPTASVLLGVTVERALKHPDWGRFVQRTAKVVHILEAKHPRCAVGELRQFPDGSRRQAMFAPRDHRVPRLKVAAADCPPDFFEQPQLYARTLFLAQITEWSEPGFARGQLSRRLGETGNVDVEMEAILLEHGVDTREFGPRDVVGLPETPWSIPADEVARRRDLREECIFTIDPLTARDLDDAVSCRELEPDRYEVGVHIADVSYFLRPGVPADRTAAERCNSVYLVHKVIPMLPRLLCEDLCSLNPAQDRLAFSVVWTLDAEGRVFDEWFGRTVIRSCTKMAYEHAQRIIDEPEREFPEEELPPIDGRWSQQDVRQRVLVLHRMAVCMRQRRTEDGALRLDQPKLCFSLDGPNGAPTGFYTYRQQASNRLIEEFMLLANMAVARRILRSFPALSVLRRHAPPQEGPLADAAQLLRGAGLEIDVETSGTVHDSLQEMAARWQEELGPEEAVARMAVVVNLLSKPMNPAEYFCSGVLTEAAQYRHYALSVPLYTHFTSPIRRYPDVLVHRLLAAALKQERPLPLPPRDVQRICVRCNEQKLAARLCSESCALLFLAHLVDLCGPLHQPAVVMAVLDKSFDVFLPELAVSRRVYIDKLDVEALEFSKAGGVPRLRLHWRATASEPACTQVVELFSRLLVSLQPTQEPLKFITVAFRPGAAPQPEPGPGLEQELELELELGLGLGQEQGQEQEQEPVG